MTSRILVSNLSLLKELELLAGLLPGTSVVLLKGAALLASGIRDPRERAMEDADILVRPSVLPAVRRALAELGFVKKPGTPGDFIKHGLVLDVQTDIWYLSPSELDRFINDAVSAPDIGPSFLIPAPLDHLVFIIAHAAAHHGAVDARWVEDCRALMKRHPMETCASGLRERLAGLGLLEAGNWFDSCSGLGLFGPAISSGLAGRAPAPSPGLSGDLVSEWDGEHRGHLLRLLRLRDWKSRGRHLLRQAFPPAEVVAMRYDLQSPGAVALWRLLRPMSLLGKALACVPDLAWTACRRFALSLPPRDAHESRKSFQLFYESEEEARLEAPPSWEPWEQALLDGPLARLERPAPGSRLLDIGCGAGREAILFSRLGFRVTGLDTSAAMTAAARRACSEAGTACDISHADPEAAAFPDASFDVAYLTRTLFSLYIGRARRAGLLRRFRAWLKPGGLLLLCVYERPADEGPGPALSWRLRSLAGRLLRRHPWEAGDTWMRVSQGNGRDSMAVFHRFAPGELASELAEAGFEPDQGPVPGCWIGRRPAD